MNKNLNKAIKIIKNGGIVIFPTDTAFGIGCRIDNEKTVRKLFKLRKRPNEKAVPILVSSIGMAEEYVEEIEPEVRIMMKKYWPGGLTIVFKCKTNMISDTVRGGGATIGLRIPKHSSIQKLIREGGVPIIGCSANFAGEETPYNLSDLNPELAKLADFVLPGRCSVKNASTVLDVTKKPWKILRPGAVQIVPLP